MIIFSDLFFLNSPKESESSFVAMWWLESENVTFRYNTYDLIRLPFDWSNESDGIDTTGAVDGGWSSDGLTGTSLVPTNNWKIVNRHLLRNSYFPNLIAEKLTLTSGDELSLRFLCDILFTEVSTFTNSGCEDTLKKKLNYDGNITSKLKNIIWYLHVLS